MAPHDERERPQRLITEEVTVSRRDFFKTVGATSLAASVLSRADAAAQARRGGSALGYPDGPGYMPIRQEVAQNLRDRGIVGYADRLRVEPGGTIQFMVSSELPSYRAEIVRLIHGDPNPDGPGIKEGHLHRRQRRVSRDPSRSAPGVIRDRGPTPTLFGSRTASPSPRGSLRPRSDRRGVRRPRRFPVSAPRGS